MSVHALPLTSYVKRRIKDCENVVKVTNGISQDNEQKMAMSPDTPLAIVPKIPVILFPADEVPRPAVIGLGGSPGSYVDSATAIKEILATVLNLPSNVKAAVTANEDLQDSDTENESSDCTNDCSDSSPDCIPLTNCKQIDVRFNRHKASWESSPANSPKDYNVNPLPSPAFPRVSVTSTRNVTGMSISPPYKCSNCTDMVFPGSAVSHLNLPLSSHKDNRRFSSPNLSVTNFKYSFDPVPRDSPSEQFTIPSAATMTHPDTHSVEDSNTFHRRSKSYSVLEACAEALTSGTETSQLHHSQENLFEATVNLEKENQHFLAADLFISVVEKIKSCLQYEQWKTEERIPWLKDPEEPCFFQRKKAHSESATSVDSGYEGLAALQNSPETIFEEEESKCLTDYREYEYEDFVVIEEDSEDLYKAKDSSNKPKRSSPAPGSNSAEQTARNLYRDFRQQWCHVVGGVYVPTMTTFTPLLCCENNITEEFESSVSLVEEIKRFKQMENEVWSPPQFQIITTIHPYMKRDVIVASQNYLCAGCGTKVEQKYTNRLRYCDYLGKYFCDCCHSYAESFIPGRILSKWSFSKSYVSNFAKNILDRTWDTHKFNLQTENAALYNKVRDLKRIQEVQQQLIYIRKLVTMCRFADSVVQAFAELPAHLTQDLHLFTLSDLYEVKQKTLLPSLRDLLAIGISHVEKCELCQAKGFICEFCQSAEVIFPFQTELCRKCEDCKACYHKQCFKTNECPKCARIKAREALKTDSPFTSSGEMDLCSST